MKNILKNLLLIALILFAISNNYSYARGKKIIKIAILDNPVLFARHNSVSENLQKAYMQGINTAVEAGKEKGYDIQYKTFFYGNNLLDIINKISDVKKWNPDVIVGLHSSNQFLITRNYFTDIVVISLFATDKNIKNIPPNFYSLGVADQIAIEPIPKFISDFFPKRNIFIAIEADSKESADLAELFKLLIMQKNMSISISESKFLHDEVDTLDIKDFMSGYKKGDIILVLAGNYYQTAELMGKISAYLYPYKPDFVVTVDNWGNEKVPTENVFPYKAYRVTPYTVGPNTPNYRDFYDAFVKINHIKPENLVSHITFNAIDSIIEALEQYPPKKNYTMRENIVQSYQEAFSKNSSWFKSNRDYIYLMLPGQEKLLNVSYPLKK